MHGYRIKRYRRPIYSRTTFLILFLNYCRRQKIFLKKIAYLFFLWTRIVTSRYLLLYKVRCTNSGWLMVSHLSLLLHYLKGFQVFKFGLKPVWSYVQWIQVIFWENWNIVFIQSFLFFLETGFVSIDARI